MAAANGLVIVSIAVNNNCVTVCSNFWFAHNGDTMSNKSCYPAVDWHKSSMIQLSLFYFYLGHNTYIELCRLSHSRWMCECVSKHVSETVHQLLLTIVGGHVDRTRNASANWSACTGHCCAINKIRSSCSVVVWGQARGATHTHTLCDTQTSYRAGCYGLRVKDWASESIIFVPVLCMFSI